MQLCLGLGSMLQLEHRGHVRVDTALIDQPSDLDELGAIGVCDGRINPVAR